jgi:hypothetical protein
VLPHAVNVSPSRRHSKPAPGSVAEKPKSAEPERCVPDGPVSIVVSGGVTSAASTVQVRLAGVASMLPAASMARTRKVWLPALRPA